MPGFLFLEHFHHTNLEKDEATVDGSEIQRSPVEGKVVEIPLFTGF